MKVAWISQPWNSIAPGQTSGSIAIWTEQMARRLAGEAEVTVYARRERGNPKFEANGGVAYRRFWTGPDAALVKLLKRQPGGRSPRRPLFSSSVYYLGYLLQIVRDLEENPADIIHIHNLSQFVPVVRTVLPSSRIVLHMHAEWLGQLDPAMLAPRLEKTDLILGCSQYITAVGQAAFPRLASRFETVYNGVDAGAFSPQSRRARKDAPHLVYVGRISPEKGLHVLLEAFPQVLMLYPQARLTLIGPDAPTPADFLARLSASPEVAALQRFYPSMAPMGTRGGYGAQLRRMVTELTARQITFSGPVPYTRLPAQYQSADALVNPSLSEAFGMSLVEAMACGLPVAASAVGGMREVVQDGQTGFLVRPGDARALARAILRLFGNPELRASMGRAGRERVTQQFTWELIAAGLLERYHRLYQI